MLEEISRASTGETTAETSNSFRFRSDTSYFRMSGWLTKLKAGQITDILPLLEQIARGERERARESVAIDLTKERVLGGSVTGDSSTDPAPPNRLASPAPRRAV